MKNTANTSGFDIGLLGGSADPIAYIYQRAASAMTFATSNTERMRIDSSGNVGIGTSSPSAKLHVAGNVLIQNANAYNEIDFSGPEYTNIYSGTTSGMDIGITSTSSAYLRLLTNNTERMRIDSSGNVGIGTSSPLARLNVSGGVTRLQYNVADDNPLVVFNTSSTGYGPYIQAGVGVRYALHVTDYVGTSLMLIQGGGNVGIGTSSPARTLSVYSASSIPAQIESSGTDARISIFTSSGSGGQGFIQASSGALLLGSSNTERARIDSSGNLGVGTSAPKTRLQATAGGGLNAPSLGSATNAPFYVTTTDTAYGLIAGVNSSDGHVFLQAQRTDGTATAYNITLNEAGGNVLVGTTTSAYGAALAKFSVEGGNSAASVLANTGGTSYAALYVYNKSTTGNNELVGFGTEGTWTARGSITYNRTAGLTAYNTTSDYRAKDIIGPVTDAGATIDALKVYNGKMKGATIARPMLVAHEAQEVVPYAVTGEKDAVNEDGAPKFQQMDVSSLVPLLIAEIQSLRARVAQLEGN
jgi:hypothetical protein